MSISSVESEDKVTRKYHGERVIGWPHSGHHKTDFDLYGFTLLITKLTANGPNTIVISCFYLILSSNFIYN